MKLKLRKASTGAVIVTVFAVVGNALLVWALGLLGEAFRASQLASEQISLIRQYCAESGMLNQPGTCESVDVRLGDNSDELPVTADRPIQACVLEQTVAASGHLKQCDYCDMRNAMPITRGDCLKALYQAFFELKTLPDAQFAQCGHNADGNEDCRPNRSGMHWSAAVSAFYLRREIERSRAKHQSSVRGKQDAEEYPATDNKEF